CSSDLLELNGWASDGTSVSWSTTGAGTINDEGSLIATYQPTAGDAGQVIHLVLQGTNGCGIVTDTLTAAVLNAPLVNIDLTTECGSNSVAFSNTTTGASTYNWSFGDGNSSDVEAPVHQYATAGTFEATLVATSSIGCETQQTIVVIIPEVPIASFTAPLEIEAFESVDLTSTSTGATQWDWNTGDGTTDLSGETVQHVYTEEGTFQIELIVMNDAGCSDTATANITVTEFIEPVPEPITVLPAGIPTAFSPNGDGMNDVFRVRGGPFAEFDLRIYDNWGVQIFNSGEQSIGWDGSYRSKDQPGGVYIYTFKGVSMDGTVLDMAGDISIIR
ncbi:MAG: PKD domain-containing protein, partial [Bacteroidota bacterium]|nr:PKD domain-containing protein [Bacteroidota bacterium]